MDRFRQGRHEEALAEYRRLTFTNTFVQGVLAATFARLGRPADAAAALRELQGQLRDSDPAAIRVMYERWNVKGALLDALMQAIGRAASA